MKKGLLITSPAELKLEELPELIKNINDYLQEIELYLISRYNDKQNVQLSPSQAYQFFRSYERNENLRNILSYLIKFCQQIPLKKPEDSTVPDPLLQLKDFVFYQLSLLQQEDVREAVLKEHKNRGYLTMANEWYYRSRIDEKYEEQMRLFYSIDDQQRLYLLKKCLYILRELSLFWFEVRNFQVRKIRRADIYIYRLSFFLEKIADQVAHEASTASSMPD